MTGRTLTAAVETELGKPTTAPRWFVKIEFDSGDLNVWTGIGDITVFGDVYIGIGRLGNIEPIQETQGIVASGIAMSLLIIPATDDPDAIDAILNIALSEEYQGRPVTIWQGQIDHTDGTLIDDPFVRFRGKLDKMEDSEIPGSQALIKVTAENRLVDLERPRRRTYTPEDQKASHANDTFFDDVASLQNREISLGNAKTSAWARTNAPQSTVGTGR